MEPLIQLQKPVGNSGLQCLALFRGNGLMPKAALSIIPSIAESFALSREFLHWILRAGPCPACVDAYTFDLRVGAVDTSARA